MNAQTKITAALEPTKLLDASDRAHRISLSLYAAFEHHGDNAASEAQSLASALYSLEVLAGYLGARVVYDGAREDAQIGGAS